MQENFRRKYGKRNFDCLQH